MKPSKIFDFRWLSSNFFWMWKYSMTTSKYFYFFSACSWLLSQGTPWKPAIFKNYSSDLSGVKGNDRIGIQKLHAKFHYASQHAKLSIPIEKKTKHPPRVSVKKKIGNSEKSHSYMCHWHQTTTRNPQRCNAVCPFLLFPSNSKKPILAPQTINTSVKTSKNFTALFSKFMTARYHIAASFLQNQRNIFVSGQLKSAYRILLRTLFKLCVILNGEIRWAERC